VKTPALCHLQSSRHPVRYETYTLTLNHAPDSHLAPSHHSFSTIHTSDSLFEHLQSHHHTTRYPPKIHKDNDYRVYHSSIISPQASTPTAAIMTTASAPRPRALAQCLSGSSKTRDLQLRFIQSENKDVEGDLLAISQEAYIQFPHMAVGAPPIPAPRGPQTNRMSASKPRHLFQSV